MPQIVPMFSPLFTWTNAPPPLAQGIPALVK